MTRQIELFGDKVSPADVANAIVKEQYIKLGTKKCACHLTLRDGWEVVGIAGVVNPDLYDEKIGQEIALEKAKDKVWLHLGSLLQNKLAGK